MRRAFAITGLWVLSLLGAGITHADDFVEDVYYWEEPSVQRESGTLVPHYNTRVREIVFVEDTVTQQPADTLRAMMP